MAKHEQAKIGIIISGASGSLLALKSLELLDQLKSKNPDMSSHVIITDGGRRTFELELSPNQQDKLLTLPDMLYDDRDLAAPIASGSNPLDGMLVVPCSIRSLSAIAYGQTDRLSIRAADVMLKERPPLVLAVRETPFHLGHLQAMTQVTQMGGIIAPPLPAFYLGAQSIDDIAHQSAARLLSLLGLNLKDHMRRWGDQAD